MLAPLLLAASMIFSYPARADRGYVDSPETPSVEQNEYIIARSASYPFVQTAGLGPCLALILYDPYRRIGALAHFGASADVPETISLIFRGLLGAGARLEGLQTTVLGGWPKEYTRNPLIGGFDSASPEVLARIRAELARYALVPLEQTLDPERWGPIRNVALDLRTGAVFDYQPTAFQRQPLNRDDQHASFFRTSVLPAHPLSLDSLK